MTVGDLFWFLKHTEFYPDKVNKTPLINGVVFSIMPALTQLQYGINDSVAGNFSVYI